MLDRNIGIAEGDSRIDNEGVEAGLDNVGLSGLLPEVGVHTSIDGLTALMGLFCVAIMVGGGWVWNEWLQED